MVLSYRKAKKFAQRLEAAKASGTLPDVIMPNGKKYRDCTREEIAGYVASMDEHAEAYRKAARLVPLWTLLIIVMFVGIVHWGLNYKDHGPVAQLAVFAVLVAFGSIWLLARAVYWLIYLYCRFARRRAALRMTTMGPSGRTDGADDDLEKLTSHRMIEIGRGTQTWLS